MSCCDHRSRLVLLSVIPRAVLRLQLVFYLNTTNCEPAYVFCYAFNGNLNTLSYSLRRLTLAPYHLILSLISIGEARAVARTSLWNDFDETKVAVHPPCPPYFAMEMDSKCGRTEFEYRTALRLRQSPSSPYY